MALTKIGTDGVKDDAITSGKIPANAVESSEIADQAVSSSKIANGAVTGTKIGANVVTATHIDNNTIVAGNIADQAVTLAKLEHGTSSNNGKFLRANNGADPTFETVNTDLVSDTSPQLGGDLDTNSHHILIDDNHQVRFGDSNDFNINHNGTDTYLTNSTGNLIVQQASSNSSGDTYSKARSHYIRVDGSNNDSGIDVIQNGAVNLYYNNDKKLETDSNGVRVTAGGPHVIFKRSITANSNGDRYARILARNLSDTDMGKIEIARDSGTDDSRIDFMSKTAGQSPQPSFRLDSDGTAFFVGKLGRDINNQPSYFTNSVYGGTTVPNAVSIRTLTNGGETGLLVRGASQGGGSTDPHSCIRVDATACGNNAKQFGIYLRGRQQLSSDTTGYYGTVSASYATTYVYRAHLEKNVAAYTNGYSFHSKIDQTNSGGSSFHFRGDEGSTQRVRIELNGNIDNQNNSYGSLSDVKLKENIVDANSQWNDIKALKVRNFNFKDDPNKVKMLGLIAQEAEAVSAGLVKTENDIELDEKTGEGKVTGKTKYLKYSILYMKAIKALQEAMAKIEVLETKVTALEAA